MMKKSRLILVILCLINCNFSNAYEVKDYEKKIKNYASIKNLINKMSRDDLEKTLRQFVNSGRFSRVAKSKGHEDAFLFLTGVLKELKSNNSTLIIDEFSPDLVSAGTMYEDDFNREILNKFSPDDTNYIKWKTFTVSMIQGLTNLKGTMGKNIIWEKKGTERPNDILVLTANYDTLNHDPKTMKVDWKSEMPGADNNGTGVALLLTIAQLLNHLDLPITVRLVFLDMEEFGLLGSKDFVSKMNDKENFLGAINFVMLGNDSKKDDKENKLLNMKLYTRDPSKDKEGAEKDLELANTALKSGNSMFPIINFAITPNSMNSSSHDRFWQAKKRSICFSENWESDFNPRFHTPNDFVETINMNTFHNGAQFIASSVLAIIFGIVK